jgi:hypothetical protein
MPAWDSGAAAKDAGLDAAPGVPDAADSGSTIDDASTDGGPLPTHPCVNSLDCDTWYEFGAECVGGFCCNGERVDGVCMCGMGVGGCGDGLWNCCDDPLTHDDDDVEDCQMIPFCPGDGDF